MSSMLEQAIIDAAALREAAIQSAEQAVVEKFSNQINQTVESLLEQDEFELEEKDAGATYDDETLEESDTQAADDHDAQSGEDIDAQSMLAGLEGLLDLSEDTVVEIELPSLDANDETLVGKGKDKVTPVVAEEETVELKEVELEKLAESLKFDYKPSPDGGFANGQMKPTNAADDTPMVAELAAMIEEYNEELEEKNASLKKENKTLKDELDKISNKNAQLLEAVEQINKKFEEVQLINAKLYYTNRGLMDTSLNERQKNKIVESINEVSTIEEAKIVYETLQSTVGSSKGRKPESLSEAVNKRNSSSMILHSRKRKEEDPATADFAMRMKALAGIKTRH